MRIITPQEVASQTQNKYLGVLVAARFARFVNEFPRDRAVEIEATLTTNPLAEPVAGHLRGAHRAPGPAVPLGTGPGARAHRAGARPGPGDRGARHRQPARAGRAGSGGRPPHDA